MDSEQDKQQTESQETTASAPAKSRNGRTGVLALIVLAAVGAAVLYFNEDARQVVQRGLNQDAQGGQVAIVNGEEIPRADFNDRLEQIKAAQSAPGQQGQNSPPGSELERQVLDSMINEELLAQAAREEGIMADNERVQEQYDQISSQFESQQAFEEQIANMNTTEQDLKDALARSVAIETYLENKVPADSIEVAEEEVQAQVDQIAQQGDGGQGPDPEQIRQFVESRLVQQKRQQQVLALAEELKADSEIEILL